MPLEATFNTVNRLDMIPLDNVFHINVLPVLPYPYKKKKPPTLSSANNPIA